MRHFAEEAANRMRRDHQMFRVDQAFDALRLLDLLYRSTASAAGVAAAPAVDSWRSPRPGTAP